jgi:hypothetical protein
MKQRRKKLWIIFGTGLALLILCIFLAGKGYLMPLILLFPSYLVLFNINDTLAGIAACIQVPVYLYLISLGKTKNRKLLIGGAILLVHLLLIRAVINNKKTVANSAQPNQSVI